MAQQLSPQELDKKIAQISKSTRVTTGWGARMHNYMRMHYGWYYRWHLNPASNSIHVAGAITIGFIFTFIFVTMIGGISVIGLLQWINYFIEMN